MKKEYWLGAAVALVFIVIGLIFGLKKEEPSLPLGSGALLLSQNLPDLTGKTQALSQWKGKTLVVNFWATWCAPCVEEMPELSSLQQKDGSGNFQIIGIGIDSAEKMQEFSAKHNISYPLYVAGMQGAELSRQLGNTKGGLPFTLLVAPDGSIKKTYLGRLNLPSLRGDLGLH